MFTALTDSVTLLDRNNLRCLMHRGWTTLGHKTLNANTTQLQQAELDYIHNCQ